jgi:NAD dependent epimerase/dehydratase
VLITGAGGFIGSHLSERLVEAGAQVRAMVRYNSRSAAGWLDESPSRGEMELVAGDVRDIDTVRKAVAGSDVVFHLAALIGIPYSYDAPLSYVRTNVEGTLNVLTAAKELGVGRVIHTSTSEVYGSARHVPIREDHPLQGQSPYSASKIGADKLVEAFHLSFGLPVVTVRPFNTYGPRQSARAVIPTIAAQILSGTEVRLGNLHPTRDLNFVTDTVDAFARAAESEDVTGQTINVGTGKEIRIGDLAHRIMRIVGREVPIETGSERIRPEGSEVDRLCADNTKAKDLLGWQACVSLDEGLRRTVAWIQENLESCRADDYAV